MTERTLPPQFCNPEFRFLLVPTKEKKPLASWKDPANHLKPDDPVLIKHISSSGNVGVISGYGGLVVIDCDKEELSDQIQERLPPTLIEKTAKGLHFFFICNGVDFYKSLDLKDAANTTTHYGEIRGDKGHQTVITPSIHSSGVDYRIVADRPIADVALDDVLAATKRFDQERKLSWRKSDYKEYPDYPIKNVVDLSSLRMLSRGEYQGAHPVHGSETGVNFCVNVEKNLWHCFRHNAGGTALHLVAQLEGLAECGQEIDSATYLKVLKIATEKYGIRIAKQKIIKAVSDRTDFVKLAEDLVNEIKMHYDDAGLWWIWDGLKWQRVDDIDVLNAIYESLNFSGILSQEIKNQLLTALKMVARKNRPVEPPDNLILTMSGIYDIRTGEISEHSSSYFFRNIVPWKVGESEDCEHIDELLRSWNSSQLEQMYEILAYSLHRGYPIQRIFCLLGTGGNGKGSFVRLLTRMLGEENVASFSLNRLIADKFQTSKLYHRLIGVTTEIDYKMFENTSLMKALVGGDPIPIEFKNKTPFDFFNYAKIIVSTNSLPTTLDKTPGFYRRWLILDFPNTFNDGKEIVSSVPAREFENLLRKLLKMLPKLLDRGKFTDEGTWKEKERLYEMKSNPIDLFIQRYCIKDENAFLPMFRFREKFAGFAIQNGYRRLSDREIWGLLDSMAFESDRQRITIKDDEGYNKEIQVRGILGLRFREDKANESDESLYGWASKEKAV